METADSQAAVPEAGMTLCVAGAGRIERSETRGEKRLRI